MKQTWLFLHPNEVKFELCYDSSDELTYWEPTSELEDDEYDEDAIKDEVQQVQ